MSAQAPILFGKFVVTSQVFYKTKWSFGLVNIRPIVPGHVLVCPRRVVSRISQMTEEEAIDFYSSVQKVARVVETHYKADSLNIAIQDGPLAGQTVPHVHCHIIPRRLNDLPNVDDIYKKLNGKEGDLEYVFSVLKANANGDKAFQSPDDTRGGPRTLEVMQDEAQMLSKLF
ncbi:uncharacterized protein SAPINGB_P000106 [Magnusiomyces paraingens]|uniref:Bis(5'-adenosyl)-triphosphatase n=1 Tax=Magnusiomyces paraingens TaxID=2606893 RepID=A0A5E8B489_9ASCO|nr:uncharacterized protein SAPINGB_P000106 [Saprochaete ingens]VVT43700.1 unnamed protein product [Saprochaete ingens]